MGYRFIAAVSFFLSAISLAAPETGGVRILFLGDSLTEGLGIDPEVAFPARLEAMLNARGTKNIVVINGGVSGSTTAGGLSRLDWLLKGRPTHIVLALGANDGLRGLSLQDSEKNLEKVIVRCRDAGIKVLIAGMKIPPNYGESYTKEFEAIYPRLAERHKLRRIDFLLEGVAGNPKLNQPDGIHPNSDGHRAIAERIFNAIQEFSRD